MSSRVTRPRTRPVSMRTRRQRIAAGAVLATTGLLGTYLAAIRPQPTYASQGGVVQQGQGFAPRNSGLCAIADDTTVYDDTSLRTAVTQSTDGDVICIGASIQLSGTLNIDDTTITLIGDDSSITLTAAAGARIIYADFTSGGAGGQDDTLSIIDLTLTGASITINGGAVRVYGYYGDADAVIIERASFTNNLARDGGASDIENADVSISDSTFDQNISSALTRNGGALNIYSSSNLRRINITDSVFTDNSTTVKGGAVYLGGYALGDITDSFFSGNTAQTGGAVFSSLDSQQAISLSIGRSTFENNSATVSSGGAIHAYYGVSITNSLFSANSAAGNGGAIRVGNSLDLRNSLLMGNDSDGNGGALYLNGDTTEPSSITASSFISNGDDSAVTLGGALYKYYGDLTVTNSLFTDNKAERGGGVYIRSDAGYDDTIIYSTISSNRATGSTPPSNSQGGGIFVDDTVTILNSIVSGNTATLFFDARLNPTYGDIRNNLFTSGSTTNNSGTGAAVGAPQLGAATDNGGPLIGFDDTFLPTAIPDSTSPAVGLADPTLTPSITTTQVGSARVGNVAGSMNAAAAPTPPTPPTPTPTYPPSAPLNVTGTGGDASATITWTEPTSSGSFPITNYQVVLAPGAATCLVQAPALSCTIDGLTNGTEYTATARALNGSGWGPYSTASGPFTPENPTPPVTKTIVITGSRTEVRGKPGVQANGTTTGLVGATVQARVHLAGEVDYYDGSKRTVNDDGTFVWSRRTGKKTYVFFTAEDGTIRSNKVIIAAK